MDRLFENITKTPMPELPKLYSKELESIVKSCLEKNPMKRMSVKQFLDNFTVKIYSNILIDTNDDNSHIVNGKIPFMNTIQLPRNNR